MRYAKRIETRARGLPTDYKALVGQIVVDGVAIAKHHRQTFYDKVVSLLGGYES
jgi:hypothetical protein